LKGGGRIKPKHRRRYKKKGGRRKEKGVLKVISWGHTTIFGRVISESQKPKKKKNPRKKVTEPSKN